MNRIYKVLPANRGECPCCNGTGRTTPAEGTKYLSVMAGYDKVNNTLPCNNCGAQYMFGKSTGHVKLDHDCEPCHHFYVGKDVGRSRTKYICRHCDESYEIDSGD
jgi:hypothetical protein